MINFFSKENRQSTHLGWAWNELYDQLVRSGHPGTTTTKKMTPRSRKACSAVSILPYKLSSVVQKHVGGVKIGLSIFHGLE